MKLLNTLALTATLLTSCTPAMAITELEARYCKVVQGIAVTAMTAAQFQEDYLDFIASTGYNPLVVKLYSEAYKIAETELYVTDEHRDRIIRRFANQKALECIQEKEGKGRE